MNELVEQNLGLVGYVVKHLKGKNIRIEYDDLFQVGCIGLIKAAKNFNPELGFKFATYAVPMIKGEIRRYCRENGRAVHVPRSTAELANEITSHHLRECSTAEIVEKIGCNLEQAERALTVANLKIKSINRQIKNDTNHEMLDLFSQHVDFTTVIIDDFLKGLPKRDREIVKHKLDGLTQAEIGQRFGYCQAHISRLMIAIKTKLERYIEAV